MFANAVGARFVGLVDMNARGRLARAGAPDIGCALDALAHGMVEDENAIGFQRRLEEGFHGGIVDVAHFLLVVEILDDGGMADQRKAFAVQREVGGDQARVEDRDVVRLGQRGGFGLARRRIEGLGVGLSFCWREIVQLGVNEGKRLEFGLLQAHGGLLDSIVVLFDLGAGTRPDKTIPKIATLSLPATRKGENPCPKSRADRTVFSALTRSSSRASAALQAGALADGFRKRAVDDIGRVEVLLD
jgi:hypothetical protein